MRTLQQVLRSDDGATVVEYAIMVSFITGVCVTMVVTFGQSVGNQFSTMNASF